MKIYRVPNEAILDTRVFIGSQEGQFACVVDPEDETRFFLLPCESCESSYLKGYTEVACKEDDYTNTYPSFLYGLERRDWKNWSFDSVEKRTKKLLALLETGDRYAFDSAAIKMRRNSDEIETMKIPSECLAERVIHWSPNVPQESMEKRYEIQVEIGGLAHRFPVAKEALGYSHSHKTYYLDIRKGAMRDAIIDTAEGRILAPVCIDDVKAALDKARCKIYEDDKT